MVNSFFKTVATYILAPLPNALCGRCSGEDDIMSDYNRYELYIYIYIYIYICVCVCVCMCVCVLNIQSFYYHDSGVIDAGHFITGMFIVTGFCKFIQLEYK